MGLYTYYDLFLLDLVVTAAHLYTLLQFDSTRQTVQRVFGDTRHLTGKLIGIIIKLDIKVINFVI